MKKFFSSQIMNHVLRLFVMAAVILTSSTAFASSHIEQIMEGADLTSIKRLALARPHHYKVPGVSDEPTLETFIEIMGSYDKTKNYQIIPYDTMVSAIKSDTGVDINTLGYRDLENTFKDNVGKYADAFVTVTTANNDDPTIFLFEVQNAQTKEVMYILKMRNASFGKNSKGYSSACESFYRSLDSAIEKAMKK